MKTNKLLMGKIVKIFLIYEDRHKENMFAMLNNTPEPYPNTPCSSRIWFRGLAIWGRDWSTEAYIQGEDWWKNL